MSTSIKTAFEVIVNRATNELSGTDWGGQDIYEAVAEAIRLHLPTRTLSPVEKTYGIMVLFDEYGVHHEYILEEVDLDKLTLEIDTMYWDASTSALSEEVEHRLSDEDSKQDGVKRIEYDTETPLAVRLTDVPSAESFVEQLLAEVTDKMGALDLTEDNIIGACQHAFKENRSIWHDLDPAQQVHLARGIERQYGSAPYSYHESPSEIHNWEDPIYRAPIWVHMDTILNREYRKTVDPADTIAA